VQGCAAVSFVLELEVSELDWELAERLERRTIEAGAITVHPGRRRRWFRPRPPSLWIEDQRDGVPVLSDQADWDQDAFTLDEQGRELLAKTISILDQALACSWSLRAYWVGDPLQHEHETTAPELAELVRHSALDRKTRYRVRPK
jgi:hypothetical protein